MSGQDSEFNSILFNSGLVFWDGLTSATVLTIPKSLLDDFVPRPEIKTPLSWLLPILSLYNFF